MLSITFLVTLRLCVLLCLNRMFLEGMTIMSCLNCLLAQVHTFNFIVTYWNSDLSDWSSCSGRVSTGHRPSRQPYQILPNKGGDGYVEGKCKLSYFHRLIVIDIRSWELRDSRSSGAWANRWSLFYSSEPVHEQAPPADVIDNLNCVSCLKFFSTLIYLLYCVYVLRILVVTRKV